MKTSAFYALAAGQLVAGHATFQSFVLNGKDQGQHKAVRTPSNGNNPIFDVTSTAMICNGGTAASDTLEVTGGQKITLQWHHNDPATTSGDSDEPIASSHKGPVMVYIAPTSSDGKGAVWVKLYEDGLTNGKWGVDNFITNKGQITFTLPDLAAGEYLVRPEIIALHEASTQGKAQLYNGCGQIKVTSSGSKTLPSGVDMTKAYSATDPGILVNIYNGITSYTIPGPSVWDGASSGSSSGSGSSAAASTTAAATKTSAAASKTSAAATTAAPKTTTTPAQNVATPSSTKKATPTSTKTAQPTATSGSSSGSTLPETFTIDQFITWLKETTGTTNARRFANKFAARPHARAFL